MNEILPVDRWRRHYVIPLDQKSRKMLRDAAREEGWKIQKVDQIGGFEFRHDTFYVDASSDRYADVMQNLIEVRGGWKGWWTEPAAGGVMFRRFLEGPDAEVESELSRVVVMHDANPERVRQLKRNLMN